MQSDHTTKLLTHGIAAYKLGKYQLAKEKLSLVEPLIFSDFRASYYLGQSLFYLDQKTEARQVFEKGLLKYPNHFTLLNSLANLEFNLQNFASAKMHAQEAIKVKAGHFLPFYILAEIFLFENNLPEAEKYANLWLKIKPNDADVFDLLARVFWKKKELEKAVEYFEIAMKIDPGNASVQNNYSHFLSENGDRNLASDLAKNAMKSKLDLYIREKQLILMQTNWFGLTTEEEKQATSNLLFTAPLIRLLLRKTKTFKAKRKITIFGNDDILVEYENGKKYENNLTTYRFKARFINKPSFISWSRREPQTAEGKDSYGRLFRNCFIPKRVLSPEQIDLLKTKFE